jgi:outer membrane receptor for ferrienterochelin and colicin
VFPTKIFLCFLRYCLPLSPLLAKPKDTTALSEIKITASPIATQLQVAASSVAIIERVRFKKKNDGYVLTPILDKSQGFIMQQGALNTNRITIQFMGSNAIWHYPH